MVVLDWSRIGVKISKIKIDMRNAMRVQKLSIPSCKKYNTHLLKPFKIILQDTAGRMKKNFKSHRSCIEKHELYKKKWHDFELNMLFLIKFFHSEFFFFVYWIFRD